MEHWSLFTPRTHWIYNKTRHQLSQKAFIVARNGEKISHIIHCSCCIPVSSNYCRRHVGEMNTHWLSRLIDCCRTTNWPKKATLNWSLSEYNAEISNREFYEALYVFSRLGFNIFQLYSLWWFDGVAELEALCCSSKVVNMFDVQYV